jgi:N-acetylglutamate synthase-like GNAT family acetyltransferase
VAPDEDEHPFGVVYYRLEDDSCEVVAIVALEPGHHVGKTLMLALGELACSRGCSRIWLVTTNDNLGAQAFYAALGFDLVDVREDAIVQARVLKPEIPLLGHNGVPIRDELEFEVSLPGELSC